MPEYTFECENCKNKFEIVCSIKDYTDKQSCPMCKSSSTSRSYIDDCMNISGSVKKSDSELKTLGDLANRNRDRLSDDTKIALHKKHNEYKDVAFQKELPKGMSRIEKPKTKTKWTNDG
jgi:hypothetical protein